MSDRREDGNSFNFEYDYSKTEEENTATLNMLLRDLSVEPVQKSSQEADGAMDALKKLEPEELEQHGRTLRDLKLRSRYGINVIGVRKSASEELITALSPDYQIQNSDLIVVIGEGSRINALDLG